MGVGREATIRASQGQPRSGEQLWPFDLLLTAAYSWGVFKKARGSGFREIMQEVSLHFLIINISECTFHFPKFTPLHLTWIHSFLQKMQSVLGLIQAVNTGYL